MKHKLNLIGVAIAATFLAGCQTTPEQISNENTYLGGIHKTNTSVDTTENSYITTSTQQDTHEINDFGSQELKKTINDDYYKEKMLIEMKCQAKLSEVSESVPNHSNIPMSSKNNFSDLRDEAERVISELESRLGDGSDKELLLAYELEIARLKLEFQISSLEQNLSELEILKEFELDKTNLLSSIEYECAVKHSENRQNRVRMLDQIDRGVQLNAQFNEKLLKIEDSLDEARLELETLNTKTFDGIMY